MKRLLAALLCVACIALAGSIGSGSQDVAAAGTAERLSATSAPAVWVIVQAKPGNSGNIFVGDSTVADGNAPALAPRDSVMFDRNRDFEDYDLMDIWVDTDSNGDGVTFIYYAR